MVTEYKKKQSCLIINENNFILTVVFLMKSTESSKVCDQNKTLMI